MAEDVHEQAPIGSRNPSQLAEHCREDRAYWDR